MSQLESARCPHCGAPISLGGEAGRVRCEFCGTTSRVRRVADADPGGSPVILVKSSASANLALVLGLVAVLVVGGVAVTALRPAQPAPREASAARLHPSAPVAPPEAPTRAGAPPEATLRLERRRPLQLVDVDGDGRGEIVAFVTLRAGESETHHFAVFDSASGAEKARTPPLENLDDALVAALGNRLVIARGPGELVAYDLVSGDRQWLSTLGEPALALCAPRRAGTVLVLSESRATSFDLVTGRQSESREPCRAPLAFAFSSRSPRYRGDGSAPRGTEGVLCGSVRVMGDENYVVPDACFATAHVQSDRLEGMVGHRMWRVKDGWLVFGVRRPPPYVPMVGRIERGRFAWKAEVPAANPLEAETGGPRYTGLAGDEVVVAYSQRKGGRWYLTAFALRDGARRFTVELSRLSRGLVALAATKDAIVAQDEDGFWLIDARTGSARAKIGGHAR